MKKIFVLFCLICFGLPCFAGNLLQQEYEIKVLKDIIKDPSPMSSNKAYFIKEDYYVCLNKGDSYYGMILNYIDDFKKTNSPNKELNIRYLKLMKSKMDNVIAISDSSIDSGLTLRGSLSKIIIDDADYKKLEKKTIGAVAGFNLMFAE